MCEKDKLNLIIKEVTKTYKEIYGDNLVDIFLYGSYARGDYNEYSDIDLAAIVKGDRMILQNELKKVWGISADLGLEYDVIISPIVIPYDEYHRFKKILPYYRNISNEGVKIRV